MTRRGAVTVHATCLVVGEAGILIRGESGSGKTGLALAVIDRAHGLGRHAGLVGDDRIMLAPRNDRLVARPHPALEGLAEIRFHGIRRLAWTLDAAVVRLVVDLEPGMERLPAAPEPTADILGAEVPRLVLASGTVRAGHAVRLVLDALDHVIGCVAGRTHPPFLTLWHANHL